MANDDNTTDIDSSPRTNETLVASRRVLKSFAQDVESLWCPTCIEVLQEPPTPLVFVRDYVSKSRPCIIRNAIQDASTTGTALNVTLDDLVNLCKDNVQMTVDVTPDGHGDVVRTVVNNANGGQTHMFVKPLECKMGLSEFCHELRSSRTARVIDENAQQHPMDDDNRLILPLLATTSPSNVIAKDIDSSHPAVYYYSRQNDCLRTELQDLFCSNLVFPPTLDWAEAAFGTGPPDAINLWIGDERAVSSMHKDHYENLFYVSSGEKIFTLVPPACAPFMYSSQFTSGTFAQQHDDGKWIVVPDVNDNDNNSPQFAQWIEPNIEILLSNDEDAKRRLLQRFPLLKHVHPQQVHVRAGDMLYLPALWFHRVTQTCETVGCNYWYDMHFDSPMWCYFNLLQQLE